MSVVVACHTDCYGPSSPAEVFQSVARLGLKCVELPVRFAWQWAQVGRARAVSLDASAGELHDLERLLADCGLSVVSCDLTSLGPVGPERLDALRRGFELAAELGAEAVVVDAGEAVDPDEREERFGLLRQLGELARSLGLRCCLDVAPGLCRHHRPMLETVEAVGHPNVLLNFDPGKLYYLNENAEPEASLVKVCQYVGHVHLRDSTGVCGEAYFPALGAGGAVDFFRLREVLQTVNFAGPYSVVVLGEPDEPPVSLDESERRLAESLDYLRVCGYFD